MRVVDEGLGLPAPGERGPRGRGRGDHGAGGVHRVAAPVEGLRAHGGGDRLAGDVRAVLAVERGLVSAPLRLRPAEYHTRAHHRGHRRPREAAHPGAALLRLLSGSHASLLLGRPEEHMADFAATHASRRRAAAFEEARFEGGALETQVSVSALFVYPVKSARGIARSRVRVSASGFEWDRQWMLIDARGTFLSQRTHPQLARIVPEIGADHLVLHAPGVPALGVPLTNTG